MLKRIDLGIALVALGGALLLVSLPLDWYGRSAAWDAFEVVDWLLLALALALLAGAAKAVTGLDGPPSWLPIVAGAALLLVVAMLLDPPPAERGSEREIGAWLALGATVLAAAGAALALAHVSVNIDVRGRERRTRVAAVDRRDGEKGPGDGPGPARSDAPAPASSPGPATAAGAAAAEDRTQVVAAEPADPDRTQPFRPE